ncbi:hypothetical protein E3T26_15500 [Cryobacterium sp. TMT1-21]|uniref:Uncharacterized protein n=1 Tax=Cryobacterium shii TaxID=1259235 RepID=A0AAQ2C402_9MICO|nr:MULTISPECIES: hypothetical protein [Cryobacterium]TFC41822.1 hypothetical protein E3O49_15710 [Cryobacterium shii]TFC88079.1 hypothetical protein E3T24_03800 [Cryobacterium sp. TmT2-59]TFD08619.1 hypothetical protein E3T26_15500 [Cryobacterium sp. TMT1-21]TFD14816.1 hypothetical protein E3T42_11280 [Cryobacterium sp. TMT4-10]TFD20026.1 hypothetical protein E3T32_09585 [Cryobacterium sp. TMT2-23]
MTQNTPRKPGRSALMTPKETFGFSGVMALFLGLVVLMSTRDVLLALFGTAVTFVVVLGVILVLMRAMKPNSAEQTDTDGETHGFNLNP